MQAGVAAGCAQLQNERDWTQRQLDRLVDALADGAPVSTVKDRMVGLETRKQELTAEIAAGVAAAPRLNPGLAQVCAP